MTLPTGASIAADDAELASMAASAIAEGHDLIASVAAGDVLRTLGLDRPRTGADSIGYAMDLGLIGFDDPGGQDELPTVHDSSVRPFMAHVLVANRFWSRPPERSDGALGPWWVDAGALVGARRVTAIMNAAWRGPLRLGPKAHLNDGLLDVTTGELPLREVSEARRRSATGTHLPHPGLAVRRTRMWSTTFDRPRDIVVDGRPAGRHRHLTVVVLPDALTVVA